MENKRVSIITPMYNAEKTIAQTIESVLKQSYDNWEMIIMDDCSSDKCAEIVRSYQEKDNRIHYYREESNCGVARTRNDAVLKAEGRYLAFLDSDDIWKADKLKRQIEFMEQNEAAFCYTACSVIDEAGNPAGKTRYVPEVADYKQLLKGNYIPCLTVLLDREQIELPAFPQIPHEDYAVWLTILQNGTKAYGINEVLAEYRVNKSSVSADKWKAAGWTWNIYRKQQKLGLLKCWYYFVRYVIRALGKRV